MGDMELLYFCDKTVCSMIKVADNYCSKLSSTKHLSPAIFVQYVKIQRVIN